MWTALVPMMIIIWNMLTGRINEIKAKADAALPRREWQDAREDSRVERERLRDDVKELFSKADNTKDLINERVESVRESIGRQVESLRQDVNSGFNSIREEMRQKKHS